MSVASGPIPVEEATPAQLQLPRGYQLDLGRRGRTFYRTLEGPTDAPTVLLLHGWMASAALNWFQVFGPLADHFRVIAPDVRGHARGLRSRQRFTLARCADDVAELLVELDTGPVIAVGYSMGGPISQLLWRRHRDLVDGLVLCATAPGFLPVAHERVIFQTLMAAVTVGTRVGGAMGRLPFMAGRFLPVSVPDLPQPVQAWAAAEFRRHDVRQVLEAGHAIGTYSARRWIDEIDVPTTVVVTSQDRAVPPHLQVNMADSIPGSVTQVVEGGHIVCADPRFAEDLLSACLGTSERIQRWSATRDPQS